MIFLTINVGMRLRKARESMNLSIEDIARRTRIQKKYLIAIEKGQYDLLPSRVYLRSYLRSYARIVGEDPQLLNQSISTKENALPDNQPSRFVKRKSRPFPLIEPTSPRHKILLEDDDVSSQFQVSPFVPGKKRATRMKKEKSVPLSERQEWSEGKNSKQEVAVSREEIGPLPKVVLPRDLPKPEELGIQSETVTAKVDANFLSRRNTYQKEPSKEIKSFGRIYSWVLIVSAVLLIVAIVLIFIAKGDHLAADSNRKAHLEVNNKKPLLRELQTGIDYARYELAYADKIDVLIRGKKGDSSFEISEKEINPPLHKGEVTKIKDFTSAYKKTIWIKLSNPENVEVMINGYPLKTSGYSKEMKYVITLLH